MKTQPLSSTQEASLRPTPVEIWKQLIIYLLEQHYGLSLYDTPFGNDGVIPEHIDSNISLCGTVNFIVEKNDLVRIDRRCFSKKNSPRSSAVLISSAPARPADW